MMHIQDLNPIFKTSAANQINNSYGNIHNSINNNTSNVQSTHLNRFPSSNTMNNPALTPSSSLNNNYINNNATGTNQPSDDKPMLTYTNFYKFCCLKNVNCYFYQFNTTTSSTTSASASIYEVLRYEKLIKHKLKNDYHINDIITWIAKKELCLFQLQIDNPEESFDPNISFNQLKDAMSNIISENKLSLKLLSASTFDSHKIYDISLSNLHSTHAQHQKKSMNVIYLSFLKAVHKFILHKMTKSHFLFEASNQSLSIEILPYSGQLIALSMIQKTYVNAPGSTNASKKKKIMKKLVPYSILKLSPSLNQKNELIVNITRLKKMFYRLTDYINMSCNGNFEELDKKSKFALYIAPSGIRCLIAGENYQDSITDELPENYEKLLNVLKTFNDIDLFSNPSLVNDKRYWIKIHPCGFSSSNTTPIIANYLDNTVSTGKKYVFWPLDLCFIQFPSDSTLDLDLSEPLQPNTFSIDDPFQIVDDFIEIVEDLEISKLQKNHTSQTSASPSKISVNEEGKESVKSEANVENQRSDFKFPDNFTFNTGIESIDQQLKPLGGPEIDGLTEIMKSNNEFDNLFNEKNMEDIHLDLDNFGKSSDDVYFQKQMNNVFDYNSVAPKSGYENNDFAKNDNTEDRNKEIQNYTNHNTDNIDNIPEINVHNKDTDANFDEDWDDLFGESMVDDENDAKSIQTSNPNDNLDQEIDSAMADLEKEIKLHDTSVLSYSQDKLNSGDAPENKKNSPSTNNLAVTTDNRSIESTSPFYQDPGAPSPIPFQIFAPEPSPKEPAIPNDESQIKKPQLLTPRESKKSIFSPLNFNPLIEKDIDSKYSNGGKFFVRSFSTGYDDNDLKKRSEESNKKSLIPPHDIIGINTDSKFSLGEALNTPLFTYPGRNIELGGLENTSNVLSDSDDDDDDVDNISKKFPQSSNSEPLNQGDFENIQTVSNPSTKFESHPMNDYDINNSMNLNLGTTYANIENGEVADEQNPSLERRSDLLFMDLPGNNENDEMIYDLEDATKNNEFSNLLSEEDMRDEFDDVEDDDDDDESGKVDENKLLFDNTKFHNASGIQLSNTLSPSGNMKTKKSRGSISEIGTHLLNKEGNLAKRRKLGTIFATIDQNGDDEELELEFRNEDEFQNDEYERSELVNGGSDFGRENEDEIVGLSNYDIISTYHKDDMGMVNLVTPKTNGEELPEMVNIDIPNSWFYVLRLVSPIQIPFNYLGSTVLSIDMYKLTGLLPILQELVLFSQKLICNESLNMLVQNRECSAVLDEDLEYLLYKLFPKVSKLQFHELLDAQTESNCEKPFQCLFDLPITKTDQSSTIPIQNQIDLAPKSYGDTNFEFSPLLNTGVADSQNLENGPNDEIFLDTFNKEFQKLSITNSISEDNLFRINTTNLNMKRFNENIVINKFALDFWKILNLEPFSAPKNFKILLVVPSTNHQLMESASSFLNTLIYFYKVCGLGEIEMLTNTGMLNIECDSNLFDEFWNAVQVQLLSVVEEIQNSHTFDTPSNVALILIDPFQDLQSLIRMAEVSMAFESAIKTKLLHETNDNRKKKKRKNKAMISLPIAVFYKSFAIEFFYLKNNNQLVFLTNDEYVKLALELYNNCPDKQSLKDRSNVFMIEKNIQKSVDFKLKRNPRSKTLVDDRVFLHLCYERSVDKKWCVASWVDQSGSLNFTKSWYIDEEMLGSESFEKVADDIMKITMEYVKSLSSETYVVLTRLNNIIPDDELAEWKRLSMKNTDVLLVVMTAELESSTLIITNNPGPNFTVKQKDEVPRDITYTVASTNSQSQTPANFGNSSMNNAVGSVKYESPDVSMYTPLFDSNLSPLDGNSHHTQVPLQTLQPLFEEVSPPDVTVKTSMLVDISDECYGLILQVPQPLSNQPRIPIKTAFLVNTGEGVTNNKVLEINLLSCQPGISTTEFVQKLLNQYKSLSSLALYCGMSTVVRNCGNVEYDDSFDYDDDDDDYDVPMDDKYVNIGYSNDKRREKHIIQQQYTHFHRMQQRQKRRTLKDSERELDDNRLKCNVIPIHMLAVRKMLDFLTNIKVE